MGDSLNKGNAATGRTREYLTEAEVSILLDAAKKSPKNSHRNYTLILMMYRHGLRAGEAASLQWSDVSFTDSTIYIRRLKKSKSSQHPMNGDEIRALRKLKRESTPSAFVFVASNGSPLASTAISATIKRLGAGLFEFPIHAHMLRHACGYYLANKGIDTRTIQEYLGHRNIQNTERYTALDASRFRSLWS